MTTTKTFVYGFLVVILALAFTACDNGMGGKKDPDNDPDNDPVENTAPEDLSDAERWFAYVNDSSTATLDLSVDSEGVCAITVGGTVDTSWKTEAKYNYTGKENTCYIYKFEAWTESDDRTMSISYFDYSRRDLDIAGIKTISIDTVKTTYTLYGPKIPTDGVRTFEFNCADQLGIFYVKIISITEYNEEDRPDAERWTSFIEDDSTATLTYSVDSASGGVCAITVGGVAMPNESGNYNIYKASAHYIYIGTANTNYEYKFQAWTQSGERDLWVEYYWSAEGGSKGEMITLSETKQIFTMTGRIPEVPKGGYLTLVFQCADQLGTFYVRMISIEAVP